MAMAAAVRVQRQARHSPLLPLPLHLPPPAASRSLVVRHLATAATMATVEEEAVTEGAAVLEAVDAAGSDARNVRWMSSSRPSAHR